MPPEYNWKAILFGAIPISVIMYFVFTSGSSNNLKMFYMFIGAFVALGITYYFDKKKHNVFTTAFVVIVISLMIHGLRRLGFI